MKSYLFATVVALALTAVRGQTNMAPGSASTPIAAPTPATPTSSSWNILSMDDGQRANLCQRQLSYCSTACGNPGAATTNFCNVTSMAWNCKCAASNNGASATYLDPVPLAECTGRAVACQAACPADANRSGCVQGCTNFYACGTAQAPSSYLQTQNENDQPSYNGPPPPTPSASPSTSVTNPTSNTNTNTNTTTTNKQSWSGKTDPRFEIACLLSFSTALLAQVYF